MANFHIVVEGEEDEFFLMGYLEYLFPRVSLDDESIKNLGGKGNLSGYTQNMQEYLDKGIKVLVIFDANSNHKEQRKEIKSILSSEIENDHDLPLFLFPDDNSDGNLENLLVQIIRPEDKGIFECFDAYTKCLKDKNDEYALPNMKEKVYSYKEAIGALCKTKRNKKNEFDSKYWNFSHPALNSLKKFLTKHIK